MKSCRRYITKNSLRPGVWVLLFIGVSSPFLAHAGFFSFIGVHPAGNVTYVQKSSALNSQTMPVLQAAVHNDPNPAKGGGDIVVVDDMALANGSSFESDDISVYKPKSDQISVYEVREGDTLSQIAEMFQVTENTIRWANDFTGAIQPGQTLVILPVTGIKHTIKSGGTVKDLAEIYDADAREIALFNGISVDAELEPGDEIVVPNGQMHVREDDKPSTSSGSSAPRRSTGGTSGGFMTHPIPGAVRTQGIHGYNAVDFGAPVGTPIYAAAGGQVIISRSGGWNGGYGTYIVIKHDNGAQTLYAHMSSVAVGMGAWVTQGEVIGRSGNTGRSTGPHLHFEVRGASNPF